jgi:uncharacterized protein YndB with AHSA1/START domain
MNMDIFHETLAFERSFDAPPARLFEAYADPRQREAWSAPNPETVIVIDETDLRTGGRETARCGSTDNLNWTMRVTYHRVEDGRLITFTEELWDGAKLLTVALITFEFRTRSDAGTLLTLTDQVTSFVGEGGVAGHREGYTKALENLAASLVPA